MTINHVLIIKRNEQWREMCPIYLGIVTILFYSSVPRGKNTKVYLGHPVEDINIGLVSRATKTHKKEMWNKRFQTSNPKSKSVQFQLSYTLRNCLAKIRHHLLHHPAFCCFSLPPPHTHHTCTYIQKMSLTSICKYMELVQVALVSEHLKVHICPDVKQRHTFWCKQ